MDQPMKKAISSSKNVIIPQEATDDADISESRASSSSLSDVTIASEGHITEHTFESLDISTKTKKAISSVLQYKFMTAVQHQSMPSILQGDIILLFVYFNLYLQYRHH